MNLKRLIKILTETTEISYLIIGMRNPKSKILEEQLQRLNSERFTLEKNLTEEIQRLKYELNKQRNNFSQIREQEINNLNQSISQLTAQKQQIEVQYNQLSHEYQTLLQNMNTLSADQSQYLNVFQTKEKQNQDDRKLYETVYNKAIAEKDSIQKEVMDSDFFKVVKIPRVSLKIFITFRVLP